jgi:hypothetical protein
MATAGNSNSIVPHAAAFAGRGFCFGDSRMYAAITLLKFLPGAGEDALDLMGSLVMPAYVERIARGTWIFRQPEDGRAMVIVLYDTREAAEAGVEQKAVEEAMANHDNMLSEPPHRDVYEVAMGTLSHAPDQLQPLSGDILSLLAEVSRSL